MQREDGKSVRVIVNGKNEGEPALEEAVQWARRHGHRIELRITRETGDAGRFAAEKTDAPADIIAAAGGDGTVNEVLNGLMTVSGFPKPALAIIPLGTANDLAIGCGIPQDEPAKALQLAWEGRPRRVDVGRANDRHFLNVASGGFAADVAGKTPASIKNVLGGAAYAVTGLLSAGSITPYRSQLILPDEQWEGDLIVITVGNGRQAGGGFPVAPKAALDDGLLDLMVIHDAGLLQSREVLNKMREAHVGEEDTYLFYKQVPAFRLELEREMRLDVDGEPLSDTRFDFSILPRRLTLMLPAETPLCWGPNQPDHAGR